MARNSGQAAIDTQAIAFMIGRRWMGGKAHSPGRGPLKAPLSALL
jgi:hypothetical protein